MGGAGHLVHGSGVPATGPSAARKVNADPNGTSGLAVRTYGERVGGGPFRWARTGGIGARSVFFQTSLVRTLR